MKNKILSILWIIIAQNSFAQIAIEGPIKDAAISALGKNTAAENKELEADKIKIQKESVWMKYIPRIEGSANYMYFNNKLDVDLPTMTLPLIGTQLFEGTSQFKNRGNILTAGVTAKMVLFSGLQIEYGAKALKKKEEGTRFLANVENSTVVKDVIQSMDQLILIAEVEQLIADSEKRLHTESVRVEKAILEGLAIPFDRDKIKLASLELEVRKVELEGKKGLLIHKIQYLTGWDTAQIRQTTYTLSPFHISQDEISGSRRDELNALCAYKEAYNYALKKEKSTFLPQIGAFGNIGYNSLFDAQITTPPLPITNQPIDLKLNHASTVPNYMVGVGLKWELFSGMERLHKIKEAKINIKQIDNQINDVESKLGLLNESNWVNYKIAEQKISLAEQQQKVANNNLELAIKQYQQGLISITQRLEAENDFYKASYNKFSSITEERLSVVEILISNGKLMNNIQ